MTLMKEKRDPEDPEMAPLSAPVRMHRIGEDHPGRTFFSRVHVCVVLPLYQGKVAVIMYTGYQSVLRVVRARIRAAGMPIVQHIAVLRSVLFLPGPVDKISNGKCSVLMKFVKEPTPGTFKLPPSNKRIR